jgi:uncharacterized SAM-binding protein YcdF (DUF218 family)
MSPAQPEVARSAGRQRGGIFFRLLFLIFSLAVLIVLYLARNPLLRLAGNLWVVDDPPAHADAIVVLSDDNFYAERAARAAELFKAGWASRVVASGRNLRAYASIAELMQHDLVDRGVPESAVVRFPNRAANTREEAEAVSAFVASHGWKRILIVTSNYHTRRARYIYERLLPAGTSLQVSAAHDSEFDPSGWWRTRVGVKRFLAETVGLLVAIWELRHNDVRSTAAGVLLPPAALLPSCIL